MANQRKDTESRGRRTGHQRHESARLEKGLRGNTAGHSRCRTADARRVGSREPTITPGESKPAPSAGHTKKKPRHPLRTAGERFAYMKTIESEYPLTDSCRALGVSRSGYYAWGRREPSPRAQANQTLTEEISELFEQRQKRYGSPRMTRELHLHLLRP